MPTVEPSRDQFAAFLRGDEDEPLTMLNLLRYRDVADYTGREELADDGPITGREAYRRYSEVALRAVREVGGEIVFHGQAQPSLIGPADERWDSVLLVRYPSRGAFLAMQRLPHYQAAVGHRSAALADSRLVPIVTD